MQTSVDNDCQSKLDMLGCSQPVKTGKSVRAAVLLQPFYGSLDFVRDNPGEPVPEETFTH